MSSRATEDRHKVQLEEIFEKAGLVCQRPCVESEESSEESEEWLDTLESEKPSFIKPIEDFAEEEDLANTIKGEGLYRNESTTAVTAEEHEGPGFPIFPTPSLAFYRPEKVKKIYEQNTVHVLPENFNTEIDANKIPRIGKHPHQYIAILAELVGYTKFESSLTEFWFLDTLANLLSRAQADHLPKSTQAILIHWFCEWMQEMRHFDMADRQRMMRRFKENMQLAAQFIAVEERLPTPQEIGVDFKEEWAFPSMDATRAPGPGPATKSTASGSPKDAVKFDPTQFECCMRDLANIIHYIYDLFNTDYQYNLVRSIFTFRPEYQLIDASFQLRVPKKAYATLKPQKYLKSPRKVLTPEPTTVNKAVLPTKEDSPEFRHLMEIKEADERDLELQLEQDRDEWNMRSAILPLAMALDENFLDKYWPPPPEAPEDLEPVPSDTKKKSAKPAKKK